MLLISAILFFVPASRAQVKEPPPSIHQLESELHAKDAMKDSVGTLSALPPSSPFRPKTHGALSRQVFGYHPYWASATAHLSYDYSALSTIGYFSYEVDTATGRALTTRNWMTTPLISYAHERGVKVVLVVTNFGSAQNTAILSDAAKQNTMIASLCTMLVARGGDGVNIDFESVPLSQRANLVSFMRALASNVRAVIPGAEISMAGPAVDWSKSWDFAALSSICDYLFLMGYDYYYAGSSTAGPNAPLEGENYTITKSVTTYLSSGVAPEKLIVGLPWFGFDWPVSSSARKSPVMGNGKSGTYAVLEPKARAFGKVFDAATKSAYFTYVLGTQFHQAWYDDSLSLAYKYALVNAKNLGGVGMWALSYEGPTPELWQGIRAAFAPVVSAVAVDGQTAPSSYRLSQNYPNPFNPSTAIMYVAPHAGRVALKIYDMLGRCVATLADEVVSAGAHTVTWHAESHPSGVYVCRLEAGSERRTIRLVLAR
ncbi:MAG: glycosyl hydrolase family 18 protein [Acidobacteriota bacterium]